MTYEETGKPQLIYEEINKQLPTPRWHRCWDNMTKTLKQQL